MTSKAFIACIDLINESDARLSKGFNELQLLGKNSCMARQSCFISNPIISLEHMLKSDGDLHAMGLDHVNLPNRFIIPHRLDNSLLVADFYAKTLTYYSASFQTDISAKSERDFIKFKKMLDAASIPHLESQDWKLVDDNSSVTRPTGPSEKFPSDIVILAIICHEILGLPLYFDYSYFVHFRANLTQSLYNKRFLF